MKTPRLVTKGSNTTLREKIGSIHPLIFLIVALYIVVPLISPRFLRLTNQMNITRQVSIYLIMAIGMTFVITSKGIDLSVGSTFGFVACVTADLVKNYGMMPELAILFGPIFGALLGLIVGLTITKLRVAPFIAGLSMMVAYRGATHLYLGGDVIVRLPDQIVWLGQGMIGFIPVPAVISLTIAFIGWFLLKYTRFGRYTIAIGSNEAACRVVGGIKVDLYKTMIYVFQGAMAGTAALIMLGRLNGTSATLGENYEMHVIASVILGGTFLHGGKGSIIGTILGVYAFGLIENTMVLVGADFHAQRVLTGIVLVAAIAFQGYRERKQGVLEATK